MKRARDDGIPLDSTSLQSIIYSFRTGPAQISTWWSTYSCQYSDKSLKTILTTAFPYDDIDSDIFLELAVEQNQHSITKFLLKCNDIDSCANGQRAFMIAIRKGYSEIVQLFLEYSDINPKLNNNEALESAVESGFDTIVAILLFGETKYDSRERYPMLLSSIEHSQTTIFSHLLCGIKLNTIQYYKVLNTTCIFNRSDILELLLLNLGHEYIDDLKDYQQKAILRSASTNITSLKILLENTSLVKYVADLILDVTSQYDINLPVLEYLLDFNTDLVGGEEAPRRINYNTYLSTVFQCITQGDFKDFSSINDSYKYSPKDFPIYRDPLINTIGKIPALRLLLRRYQWQIPPNFFFGSLNFQSHTLIEASRSGSDFTMTELLSHTNTDPTVCGNLSLFLAMAGNHRSTTDLLLQTNRFDLNKILNLDQFVHYNVSDPATKALVLSHKLKSNYILFREYVSQIGIMDICQLVVAYWI